MDALKRRLAAVVGEGPECLLFSSRRATPLAPNNVRRQLRAALTDAGITDVTPGSFRRTIATEIDRVAGAELAAPLLGHSSPEITRTHYIRKEIRVDPATAEILERFGSRPGGER
jgi:integrase